MANIVSATDVLQALKDRPDEVIQDIQHLLEGVCCNDCEACEFQYLCIRGEE